VNSTSIRRVAGPSLAVLALGLAVSACGAGNEAATTTDSSSTSLSGTLNGAGSSAQQSAQSAWSAAFGKANSGVTINYDPSGSGAGVEQFNAGAIDFAGSDAALDPTKGEVAAANKRCGADVLEVPDYVSPIAVVFNVKGITKLNLDAATIGKIFSGTITKWNDAAIAALNPGATLPSTGINPIHRSDDSGTTNNFTDYLFQASGGTWKSEANKTWPLKSGEGAAGTSGVISAVKAGDGAIGYADDSQVGTLDTAAIKVGSAWTAPSADGAAKALLASPLDTTRAAGDMAIKVDRTTTAAGAYPLMLTSYLIACPTYSADKAKVVKAYLASIVSTAGQQLAATSAGAAPLPADLQTKAAAIIDGITSK
jgi:phosphate transport system substrate-binding protein